MKLVRLQNKKNGIQYITIDSRYRIQKFYKKSDWELSEITGHGRRVIGRFKYFRDAKNYLKNQVEA